MTKKKLLSHSHVQVLHCPDCFFMSLSLSRMCEHFFTHQEAVEWQISRCLSCGLISSHDDLLDEHILLKHPKNNTSGKKMLIDSLFIPELPESYSVVKEMNPPSYNVTFSCPFCEVITSDKEVLRMHLDLCHNVANVDTVESFMTNSERITEEGKIAASVANSNNTYDYVPGYKKLKVEETHTQVLSNVNDDSTAAPKHSLFANVLYNFNLVAEKIVVNNTHPVADDPSKVIICMSDPELKMTINRDVILQSYDPEPLRFLRNIVRQGIPLEELINFSWKGNRRGRPRLMPDNPNQTTNERKSMKDDVRMRSFCKLVEEVSKKPLPDNLGTYMHQFLSNLRNKNSAY